MHHPIDPKIDRVFKALLGAEANRRRLVHFPNAVLGTGLAAAAVEVARFSVLDEAGGIEAVARPVRRQQMSNTSELYDNDYGAWAKQQIELLSRRRFADLDIAHLVEELEDMGRSERNELESRLVILLAHLLKWQYQYHRLADRWKEFKGDSWRATIIEQRDRIARRLQKTPGLRPALDDLTADAYADAVALAAKETGLPLGQFPGTCPWVLAQILDDSFFPVSVP